MQRYPVNRTFAVALVVFNFFAIVALFFFTWQRLILGVFSWYVLGCLGITMTYHRFLTHKGFKTSWLFQRFISLVACIPLQSDPITWVSWHRFHHVHSDESGVDPHTPVDGAYWAHMDWMVHQNPEIKDEKLFKKWAKDLYYDPFYMWLRKWFWVPTVVWGSMWLILGGLPALLWSTPLPIAMGWQFTWLINSGTHIWGYRRFDTKDNSKNNWWIALLTFGEGWHNNHHANQVRARHGIVWYEPDITWLTIKSLQSVGLVWDVKD